MKVVLITCPSYGILHPPLSLAYLAAVLRNRGHEVASLDLNIQLFDEMPESERDIYWNINMPHLWFDRDIIEKTISKEKLDAWAEVIIQKKPNVVGFSVYCTNLLASLMLAERLKARNNKIKIIFGGPYIRRDNAVAESVINHACVDIIVVGEGENTLEEIMYSYEKDGRFGNCRGAIIKRDGQIIDCGSREPISELDDLPFPDFSDFNFDIYKERLIPLLSSRGCLYNCAFCNEKSFWQDYRYRTADNIIQEVKHQIINYEISTFRFNDLLLNGNLSELEKFCDRVIRVGLGIKWGGYITARKMEKKLIAKMKKSGCYFIFFGIESGSQNVLDKFKKGVNVGQVEELLQLFTEIGISVHTGWIVGFPNETFGDFRQTIDFIKRNKKYIDRVAPANLMSIPPGSPIYANPIMYGVKHIVHAGEYLDSTTTLRIREARLDYFNKYMAYTDKGSVE